MLGARFSGLISRRHQPERRVFSCCWASWCCVWPQLGRWCCISRADGRPERDGALTSARSGGAAGVFA